MIVETLQGLNNMMISTFQKWCKILELIENFCFGTFVLNLECNELTFEVFQKFYTSITSSHLDFFKTSIKKIESLFLEGDADIYKILRPKLLTICGKELVVSSVAYNQVEWLFMKNIKFLIRVLTKKELERIG